MPAITPTREDALRLFIEYNKTESLMKHALSVEAVMRYFADKAGEDEEKWGIIGLLHDLDYEKYPDQHCRKTREILEDRNWPPGYIRAIVSHAWLICSDEKPECYMEKVLYATDELTGLIVTTALVRPSRSLMDLDAKSIRKKWKDRRFAAGVDRSIIERGAGMLHMDLSDLITETIAGMRTVADVLGLSGT